MRSPGKASIFRQEALEHRAQSGGPAAGDVLRAAPRWLSWGFYALLALVLAVLVAASVVNVNRYARGPVATDDRGARVILLPAALAPKVPPGSPVEADGVRGEVTLSGDVLQPEEVRRIYGIDVTEPSVPLATTMDGARPGATARVLVESGSVLTQFVPGLSSFLGGNDP